VTKIIYRVLINLVTPKARAKHEPLVQQTGHRCRVHWTSENTLDIERKNRLLKVCYVPATSAAFLAFFSFFLAVVINSTNEANKAGGTSR
jgi:hypothetical protein